MSPATVRAVLATNEAKASGGIWKNFSLSSSWLLRIIHSGWPCRFASVEGITGPYSWQVCGTHEIFAFKHFDVIFDYLIRKLFDSEAVLQHLYMPWALLEFKNSHILLLFKPWKLSLQLLLYTNGLFKYFESGKYCTAWYFVCLIAMWWQ